MGREGHGQVVKAGVPVSLGIEAAPVDAAPEAAARGTAAAALAAQYEGEIRSRIVLAQKRPRSWDDARAAILRACSRPRFADAAIYELPRDGKTISGPSIRFAEECVRAAGNIAVDALVVHDDADSLALVVRALDLEANISFAAPVELRKTIERRDPRGREVLGKRLNSRGEQVFVCRADEGELRVRVGAEVSRAMRNVALRLIPADIVEDAMEAIEKASASGAQDPEARRKAVLDAFASLRVPPSELSEYLGHDVAQASPAEILALRRLYTAIEEGSTTWAAALAEKRTRERKPEPAPAETQAPKRKASLEALRQEGAAKAKPAPEPARSREEPQGIRADEEADKVF